MDNMQITFWGDYIPTSNYESLICRSDIDALSAIRPFLKASVLNFVNVDGAIYVEGKAIRKSGPHIGLIKNTIHGLKGFTVAGICNNHIKDYGYEGMKQLREALREAGVDSTGAGVNIQDAESNYVKLFSEVEFCIISGCEQEFSHATDKECGAAPLDVISIFKRIKKAKEKNQKVILSLHAGYELFEYPTPKLRRECHFFAEAGADLIICHHSHVAGAYEKVGNTYIFYGLGDLIFEGHHGNKAGEGYGVLAKWDAESGTFDCNIIPYMQSPKIDGIKLLKGDDLKNFLQRQSVLNDHLASGDWVSQWYSFVEELKPSIFARHFLPHRFPGIAKLLKIKLVRKLLLGSNAQDKLNLVRCESLRGALVRSLESEITYD